MDEYLKSGNEEKLNQLLRYLENEKNGKSPRKLHADEAVRAEGAIDGLIQKAGHYAVGKKSVSVEAVKSDLQVGADEAEKVIGQLAKIGVIDRADEAGNYRVIMEREAFPQGIMMSSEGRL